MVQKKKTQSDHRPCPLCVRGCPSPIPWGLSPPAVPAVALLQQGSCTRGEFSSAAPGLLQMGLGSLWPCRAAESCSSGNAGGKGCCAVPGSDWIQVGMLGSSPGRSISPWDAGIGSALQGHSVAMDSRDLLEGGLAVGEIKKTAPGTAESCPSSDRWQIEHTHILQSQTSSNPQTSLHSFSLLHRLSGAGQIRAFSLRDSFLVWGLCLVLHHGLLLLVPSTCKSRHEECAALLSQCGTTPFLLV